VETIFPKANIAIISKDQAADFTELQSILESMEQGEIDILVGTQIITKGYHFPKLSLVAVVDADLGFMGGDMRASERTFQLLQQVGGRAGREAEKGEVILQTYCPDHQVIKALASGNEKDFFQQELTARQELAMPPYSRIAAVTITGKNAERTFDCAKRFAASAPRSSARILGPAEAMMLKVSNKYRYKILVLAERDFNLQKYLLHWQDSCKIPSSFQIKIDIDPYNLV